MPETPIRLDKWLWAARFFKTRGLANEAVSGGKVAVNDQRAKPSRALRIGDRLDIQRGEEHFTIVVTGLSDRRGPASVAAGLYEETPDSISYREAERRQRQLERMAMPQPPPRRPDKKARRQIVRFIRRER
jgi:ribosome-associated heat shock protein Hsp15